MAGRGPAPREATPAPRSTPQSTLRPCSSPTPVAASVPSALPPESTAPSALPPTATARGPSRRPAPAGSERRQWRRWRAGI
ncbi:unnamed protein product [Spirodela intermedia]|uniref:Uncharacterized protein n=1 Tax=Spirodela intermedia TaxID=51605 RepID=A0A7I8JU34_SPIIN|nr:unnamed protein product [Spirodela intermedia]CAA6672962.1 unnamed protein product [Spirodela intermedia]